AESARVACRDRAQRRPPAPATAPQRGAARGVRGAGSVADVRDALAARDPAEGAAGGRAVPGCARTLLRRDGGAHGNVGECRDDAPPPRAAAPPSDACRHGRWAWVLAMAEAGRHA